MKTKFSLTFHSWKSLRMNLISYISRWTMRKFVTGHERPSNIDKSSISNHLDCSTYVFQPTAPRRKSSGYSAQQPCTQTGMVGTSLMFFSFFLITELLSITTEAGLLHGSFCLPWFWCSLLDLLFLVLWSMIIVYLLLLHFLVNLIIWLIYFQLSRKLG